MNSYGDIGKLNNGMLPTVYCFIIAAALKAFVFKKSGNYTYRVVVASVLFAVSSFIGILSLPIWFLLGKRENINYTGGLAGRVLLKYFLGITATIEGKEHLAKGEREPAIYVCNHQSFLDILFISCFFPKKTSSVTKKANQYYPFFGWFLMLSKTLFLDRSNRNDSVEKLQNAANNIRQMNQSYFIFPEGTRSGGGTNAFLPFKKGAFYLASQARIPIIPVVICNYKDIYSAKNKYFGSGDLKVKVLPPISTEGVVVDSKSIQELSDKVRDQMLTALKEISPPDNE